MQEEIDKLRSDNELLRERKDHLEIQLEEMLVGVDEQKGRVLHLAQNPLSDMLNQRETELEKLQEEVNSFTN